MRSFIKDNLKLYLDFKASKHNTLKFPCEGSTDFGSSASNKYIYLGTGASLRGQTSGSICGWINASNLTSYHAIITEWNNSGFMNWGLWTSGQNLHFDDGGGTACTATSDALSLNTWHHVCITKDGTTITLYVDGVQEKQITNGAASVDNNGTGNVFIGIKENLTDDFLGKMANIGMWHRVLSLEEINSVMRKNYSQLKSVEKTSLVSWWSLDEEVADSTQLLNQATYFYDADDWLGYGGGTFDDAGGTHIAVTAGTTSEYEQGGYLYTNVSYFNGTSSNWYVGGRYRLISTTTSSIGSTTSGLSMYGHRVASAQDDLPSGSSVYDFTGATNIHNLSFFRFHDMAQGETLTTTLEIYHLLAKDQHGSNNGRQYGTGITAGTQTLGSADSPTVYGGNAPVLPRSVDVAREGEAEQIGDGSALFDGTDDYIDVGADVYDFSSGDFTISAWVYHDRESNHAGIVGVRDSTNTEVQFYIESSGRKIKSWNGSSNVEGTNAVPEAEWTHVALVQSGSNKKFYINGILDGTSSQANGTARPASLRIGDTGHTDNEHYKGSISQVGIWAGELTQAQIQSVMESTSYAKIPADVKSTLGSSEITNASDRTFSGVTSNNWASNSDVTKSFSNNQMVFTMDDDTPAGYVVQFQGSHFVGGSGIPQKFLKITLDIDSTTTGSYYIDNVGGSCSANVFLKNPLTTGVNNIYGVCDGANSYFRIFEADVSTGDKLVLNSFDVKEVTNDLVGYWGLDADNSIPVLDFDGTNDHVEFPISGTYTQFTWVGWFKADVLENTNIWEWGTSSSERLGVYTWDNDFHVKLKDQNLTTSAHGLAVNTWFHLACTYNGSTLTLYLNGSSFATASHSSVSTSPSGNLRIGGDTSAGNGYRWDGKVAQFGFYNTSLNSGQVLTQYNDGIDSDLSSDSNLVGYWKLDNASTVTDLSGNGNNGTVSGATLANYEVVLDSTDNNNNGDLL